MVVNVVVFISWDEENGLMWKCVLLGWGVFLLIVLGDKIFLICYLGYVMFVDELGWVEDL